MSEARKLSANAWEMMSEANLKMTKADELIISERNRVSTKIQEERLFQSRESARLRQRMENTINKHHCEQESTIHLLMAKSNKKYEDIQLKMIVVSTKLKDQCNIWQKWLSELDLSSKNQLSKERERRCCSIQQQLNKSSTVEDQFMEIINGLEEMNDQLVEEVNSVKKDRQVALKLYNKCKGSAEKCLKKLQLEMDEKNVLKDELTWAHKMLESQLNEIVHLLKV